MQETLSISGDFVTAPSISFDGTGDVSLAATITTDSITLGTYTTGDYVESITGTGNQITVTSGTGEGSTPVISIPDNPTLPGTTVTVANDLQVNRNLNVDWKYNSWWYFCHIIYRNIIRISDSRHRSWF